MLQAPPPRGSSHPPLQLRRRLGRQQVVSRAVLISDHVHGPEATRLLIGCGPNTTAISLTVSP